MMIILAKCGNGYCGCEEEDVFFFDEDVIEKDIDDEIYQWAIENAESYSHVYFCCDEEHSDEEYEVYIENVQYDWKVASYEEYVEWCENWNLDPNSYRGGVIDK